MSERKSGGSNVLVATVFAAANLNYTESQTPTNCKILRINMVGAQPLVRKFKKPVATDVYGDGRKVKHNWLTRFYGVRRIS